MNEELKDIPDFILTEFKNNMERGNFSMEDYEFNWYEEIDLPPDNGCKLVGKAYNLAFTLKEDEDVTAFMDYFIPADESDFAVIEFGVNRD